MPTLSDKLRSLADRLEGIQEPKLDAGYEPMVVLQYPTPDGVDKAARLLHAQVSSDGVSTRAATSCDGVWVSAACYAPVTPAAQAVVADYRDDR